MMALSSKLTMVASVMAAVLSMLALSTTYAFVTESSSRSSNVIRRVDTLLNVLPPLIIGPVLKKMREENAKKNAPMVTEEEAEGEAPGLRVGASIWKWPPVWPYDQNFFTPTEDIPTPQNSMANPMMGMLSGMPEDAMPTPEVKEIEKLDPVQYWQVEKADVKTEMDEEAADQLKS